MLVIGLTGGIGSGKSTVAAMFDALGVPVIDTDDLARDAVRPGQPALDEIRTLFGEAVVGKDGQLDRAALRERVFTDVALREGLERILHPRIREELHRRLSGLGAPYCIVAIPLLVERGWQREVDRVLVVDASEELQIRRTSARPGMDPRQARQIMDNQAGRDERLAVADDIIANDNGLDDLREAVKQLHRLYTDLATER